MKPTAPKFRLAKTDFSKLPMLFLLVLTTAGMVAIAGCKSSSDQPSQNADGQTSDASTASANPSDPGDPANANLAPIPASSSSAPATSSQSAAPAAAPDTTSGSDSGQPSADYSDTNYNPSPAQYATEPPPELPEYPQPPIPQPGYLWTPGYWSWAPQGYYWVPGAWTEPPYEGALWTPGYWGFVNGRYGFYNGYWGRYIGFYGGVNYGFGYVGVGYQGGYWQGNQFNYNRSVTNITNVHITNVYNRTIVVNRTIGNTHVSYNGGPQGVRLRPTPAEVAAFRAPHAPPMKAQVELVKASAANRAQFASVNHGKPAVFVAAKPLAADKGIHPAPEIRPAVAVKSRPQEARPEAKPEIKSEPARPTPQARPEPARPEARPAPKPEAHPAPKPESHPAPHPQAKPTPERPKEEPKKPE